MDDTITFRQHSLFEIDQQQNVNDDDNSDDKLMEMVLSPINISAQKNRLSSSSSLFNSSTTTTTTGNITTTTRTTRLFFPPMLNISTRQSFLSNHRNSNSVYINKIHINRKRKEQQQKGFMSALSLYDPSKIKTSTTTNNDNNRNIDHDGVDVNNNNNNNNNNLNNQILTGFSNYKTMPSFINSFEGLDLATSYYNVNSTIKTTSSTSASLDPFSNSAILTLTTTTTSTNSGNQQQQDQTDFLSDFENMSLSQKKPARLRFASTSHSHPPSVVKVPLKRLSPLKHFHHKSNNSARIHEI
ncbi:hypothetical protein CYY_008550 [Polysphondylium violaceum]|uniref:Uncharacterized protein n=1 Tax=Polysphondylium violaceum TaxID=133409 RepID=A0A8J4PLI9_9MYCE|nr:hypothetical protein CYY_008550 [Polysphondylium violaceum]